MSAQGLNDFDLVIFDWAGTMVDFGCRAPIEAVVAAFARRGVTLDEAAARVDMGAPHDAGVAKSSRAGTNRNVNARPMSLGKPGLKGFAPRIHTLRNPFLSKTVVIVAVVT
jgi:phosphonoacetaldehyde hydrolase